MIIPEEKHAVADSQEANFGEDPQLPPYSLSAPIPGTSTSVPGSLPDYVQKVKPANFVDLHRHTQSISDTFVIDPSLRVPEFVLPKLKNVKERKNLKLQTDTGSITADVWICPGSGSSGSAVDVKTEPQTQRTSIKMLSLTGSIKVKMHSPSQVPFYLWCETSTSSIRVFLPRTFCGPLTVRTSTGSISFSSEVSSQLTTFSEIDKTRHCFIGTYEGSDWAEAPEQWAGNEVHMLTETGSIRVLYVDETKDAAAASGEGWFGKIWKGFMPSYTDVNAPVSK